MAKEIISCICMICGVRNDHSHPAGFCQNGHDAWLEYRDVMGLEMTEDEHDEIMSRAAKIFCLTKDELTRAFLNTEVTYIPTYNSFAKEVFEIEQSGKPFDWDSIEINEWELGRRVLRAAGDCVCPICRKEYKKHSMEDRTKGEPFLYRICVGILAKL